MRAGWEVFLDPEVEDWILSLPDETYDRVEAAVDMLAEHGPRLGRPLVDSITGSRHATMKELRVGTCRVLFAVDPDPGGGAAGGRGQAWPVDAMVPPRSPDR